MRSLLAVRARVRARVCILRFADSHDAHSYRLILRYEICASARVHKPKHTHARDAHGRPLRAGSLKNMK